MVINTKNQLSIINNASVLIELPEKNSTQITELKVGQSVFCPSSSTIKAANLSNSFLIIEYDSNRKNHCVIQAWHISSSTLFRISKEMDVFGDYHFLDSNNDCNLKFIQWMNNRKMENDVFLIGFTNKPKTKHIVEQLMNCKFIPLNIDTEPINLFFDPRLSLISYSYKENEGRVFPYYMMI